MSDLQTQVKTKLPEDLHDLALKFTIPLDFFEDDLEIIVLILRSKSIDTHDEKQNWFNLLMMMNADQIEKLRQILIKEKNKLEEIENKYQTKKKELRDKYLNHWEEEWYIKKVNTIKEKESEVEQKEKEEADNLLLNL